TCSAARSRHVGSGATGAREPSQVRKEAALSGSAWVPPGRLMCAASGPLVCSSPLRSLGSGGMRERPNRHAWKACVGQLTVGSSPTPSARVSPRCHLVRFASLRLVAESARLAAVREVPIEDEGPETRFAWLGEDRIAFQVFGDGEIDLLYVSASGDPVDLRWN